MSFTVESGCAGGGASINNEHKIYLGRLGRAWIKNAAEVFHSHNQITEIIHSGFSDSSVFT